MKHYIISKFRPGTPWQEYLPEIEAIFDRTLTIEGVHGVEWTYSPPAPSGRTGLIL